MFPAAYENIGHQTEDICNSRYYKSLSCKLNVTELFKSFSTLYKKELDKNDREDITQYHHQSCIQPRQAPLHADINIV